MQALDQHFYTSFATRILIYAMAAASLNLVLGYGGMVSFGRGVLRRGRLHRRDPGGGRRDELWLAWPLAIAVAALAAAAIEAVSLRTRGCTSS